MTCVQRQPDTNCFSLNIFGWNKSPETAVIAIISVVTHEKVVPRWDNKSIGVKRVAIAPKGKASWKVSNRCRSRMIVERAQVEGVIGTTKNYEFNKPNARKTASMERAARRSELRFNLTRLLKDLAGATKSGAPA